MTWNRQLCRGGAHLPLEGLGLVKDNESIRGQEKSISIGLKFLCPAYLLRSFIHESSFFPTSCHSFDDRSDPSPSFYLILFALFSSSTISV